MRPERCAILPRHLLRLLALASLLALSAAVPENVAELTVTEITEPEEQHGDSRLVSNAVYAPRVVVAALLGFLFSTTLISAAAGWTYATDVQQHPEAPVDPPRWFLRLVRDPDGDRPRPGEHPPARVSAKRASSPQVSMPPRPCNFAAKELALRPSTCISLRPST